jgi:hypothetical protein
MISVRADRPLADSVAVSRMPDNQMQFFTVFNELVWILFSVTLTASRGDRA